MRTETALCGHSSSTAAGVCAPGAVAACPGPAGRPLGNQPARRSNTQARIALYEQIIMTHTVWIDGKLSGGEMCASQNILAVSPTKGIRRKKRSVPFALALTNNATRICYPNTSSI
ncbi:unnamed protein product [Danaus chrysippus]|uniref:(African queen) hypothetical protein n=1 Tax=Danaus chrysippus TaxID=151541 RepID=A0A8J2MWD3_9NEOP|nr:unnamed protein product [Danaus chrysippus]